MVWALGTDSAETGPELPSPHALSSPPTSTQGQLGLKPSARDRFPSFPQREAVSSRKNRVSVMGWPLAASAQGVGIVGVGRGLETPQGLTEPGSGEGLRRWGLHSPLVSSEHTVSQCGVLSHGHSYGHLTGGISSPSPTCAKYPPVFIADMATFPCLNAGRNQVHTH